MSVTVNVRFKNKEFLAFEIRDFGKIGLLRDCFHSSQRWTDEVWDVETGGCIELGLDFAEIDQMEIWGNITQTVPE